MLNIRLPGTDLNAGTTRILLDLNHDATHNLRLAYVSGPGVLFQHRLAGVNYQAVASVSFVAASGTAWPFTPRDPRVTQTDTRHPVRPR